MRYRQLIESDGLILDDTYYGDFVLNRYELNKLANIPPKVFGTFELKNCQHVTTMEGAPKHILNGVVVSYCESFQSLKGIGKFQKQLVVDHCPNFKSFEYMPADFKGNVRAIHTGLESLKGLPSTIDGHLVVDDNASLERLDHMPTEVTTSVRIAGGFKSLHGVVCKTKVAEFIGDFTTLDGLSIETDSIHLRSNNTSPNNSVSFAGVHKHIKSAAMVRCMTVSDSVLGLLLIPNLKVVSLSNAGVYDDKGKHLSAILNKWLKVGGGRQSIMECQAELIDDGFDDFAQL